MVEKHMGKVLRASIVLSAGMAGVGSAPLRAATCTVPNTIANGQVADASKVMQNFSAVANCAELGVTRTGSTALGGISVFSGAGSIASGDLTGDVTTSGGTATTLSNSGVTPGTYVNPSILVDAKGRITNAINGSAGSPGGGGFSPPLAAQFTLASGNSTNLTLVDDPTAGLLIDGGAPATGYVSRIAYQNISNKNADWEVKAKLRFFMPTDRYTGAGLMIRDSISGRITSLALQFDRSVVSANWNGFTGWGGSTPGVLNSTYEISWIRITHSGSSYVYSASSDGKQWINFYTGSDVAWLLNKADQVGLIITYDRGSTGNRSTMAVESYNLTQ